MIAINPYSLGYSDGCNHYHYGTLDRKQSLPPQCRTEYTKAFKTAIKDCSRNEGNNE